MVGRQPGMVGHRCALSAEELVALIQPVQWVDGAIIRQEFQLIELDLGIKAKRWLAALAV